jgi:hypothetical protein
VKYLLANGSNEQEVPMLIAYVTTDLVNEQLALQMAEESGQTVCPLSPCDGRPDEDFDAVVYDWDYLPRQLQQTVLAELLAGAAPWPAALHGYNVEPGHLKALRKQNVAIYRKLRPEIFRRMTPRRAYGRINHAAGAAIYASASYA